MLLLIPEYTYLLICDLSLDDLADDFENFETPDDDEDLEIPDDVEVLETPDDLASFEIPDDLASFEIPDDLESFEIPDDLASFVIPDDVDNAKILADVENFAVPAQNFLIQFSRFFLSAISEHNRHKMSANIGPIELCWVISSGFIISVIAPIVIGVLF